MVRRLSIALLFVAGAFLIFAGTRKWLEKREITAVVHSLMDSLKKGDRQVFLSLLPSGHSALTAESKDGHNSDFWSPDSKFSYEILDVVFDGEHAAVDLRIQKGGYRVHPKVHLVRSKTARWKIEYIENVSVDPRWYDQLEYQSKQEGEQTAKNIERLLKGRPGVIIERVKVPVDNDVQ